MSGIGDVVDANRAVWEEERDVCRRYFASPSRTVATDLRWLSRQAAKELHDGVHARRAALAASTDPQRVLVLAEELVEEATHYAAFATAYESLRGPAPPIAALDLAEVVSWPANRRLGQLRRQHRVEHGALGELAAVITEGGGGALYDVGAALSATPADRAIAAACAAAVDDEAGHVARAVAEAAALALDDAACAVLRRITLEQSRQRIAMREEQFGG